MEDFKKLVQEANGFLRTAQNNMFSGKNNEAVELMNKAEEL
jgi:HEPN domain-containing protein